MAENNDFMHLPLPLLFLGNLTLRGGGAVSAQTKRINVSQLALDDYIYGRSAE